MTVSSSTTSVSRSFDGATTAFPIGGLFFLDGSDLLVSFVDADGDATLKALGDDYTVTGDGRAGTGSITVSLTAQGDYESMTITRETAILQEAEFAPGSSAPAAAQEKQLDRFAMIAQEQRASTADLLGRSLRFPAGETIAELEPRADYAGKYFVGDAEGRPVPAEAPEAGTDAALRADLASAASGAALVALPLLGDATAAKTVAQALGLWHWVDRAGVLGDGTTDDTAKLQALADEAGEGAVLVFTPGKVYRINTYAFPTTGGLTAGLKIPDGQTWLINGAELKALASNQVGGSVIHGFGTSGWRILGPGKITGEKDIHVGATGEWGHGISAWSSADFVISGLEISNTWGDGIYVGAAVVGEFCERFTIEDCYIHDLSRNGISVVAGRNGVIDNVVIVTADRIAPQAGIDMEPDSTTYYNEGNTLSRIRISDCETGIAVVVANRDTIISNCNVAGNNTGIVISDNTQRLTIEGNHIRSTTGGAEGGAIRFVVGTPSTIDGVRIAGNFLRGGGFFVLDGDYAGIKGLVVSDNNFLADNAGCQGFARLNSGSFIDNDCIMGSTAGVTNERFIILGVGVTNGRNRYENRSAFTMYSSLSGTDLGGANYATSTFHRASTTGASGPHITRGTVTLVAGVGTVANTNVVAASRVAVDRHTDGGTLGVSYSITRTAGVSFTVTAKKADGTTETAETSVLNYWLEQ